tara:strand:+ start:277 stop:525 length:249 start_codon:yes stop_codon:yes gene_type:complete
MKSVLVLWLAFSILFFGYGYLRLEKENIIVKNEREDRFSLDPLTLPTCLNGPEELSPPAIKLPEKLISKFGPNTIFDEPWQD